MRMKARLATIIATASAAVLFTSTAASAASWDGSINGTGGGAGGTVSVSLRGSIDVDVTVIDTISDGFCAQMRITVDLPAYPDRDHDSPKACGYQTGKTWDTTISESGTLRGVYLKMCRVHSDGSDRSCSTEKYVNAG
ncbi:hypothetical protein [Streptomyces sp. NPDC017435]|uniref:hypothetical protein n=1 Tax=Streptomyces sp. NPDC017435 TaxID=3364995 RepID=UPI0037973B3A